MGQTLFQTKTRVLVCATTTLRIWDNVDVAENRQHGISHLRRPVCRHWPGVRRATARNPRDSVGRRRQSCDFFGWSSESSNEFKLFLAGDGWRPGVTIVRLTCVTSEGAERAQWNQFSGSLRHELPSFWWSPHILELPIDIERRKFLYIQARLTVLL